MKEKFFSIPLDTTKPEDIAALDKALDEKLNIIVKKKNEQSTEQHSA